MIRHNLREAAALLGMLMLVSTAVVTAAVRASHLFVCCCERKNELPWTAEATSKIRSCPGKPTAPPIERRRTAARNSQPVRRARFFLRPRRFIG